MGMASSTSASATAIPSTGAGRDHLRLPLLRICSGLSMRPGRRIPKHDTYRSRPPVFGQLHQYFVGE